MSSCTASAPRAPQLATAAVQPGATYRVPLPARCARCAGRQRTQGGERMGAFHALCECPVCAFDARLIGALVQRQHLVVVRACRSNGDQQRPDRQAQTRHRHSPISPHAQEAQRLRTRAVNSVRRQWIELFESCRTVSCRVGLPLSACGRLACLRHAVLDQRAQIVHLRALFCPLSLEARKQGCGAPKNRIDSMGGS